MSDENKKEMLTETEELAVRRRLIPDGGLVSPYEARALFGVIDAVRFLAAQAPKSEAVEVEGGGDYLPLAPFNEALFRSAVAGDPRQRVTMGVCVAQNLLKALDSARALAAYHEASAARGDAFIEYMKAQEETQASEARLAAARISVAKQAAARVAADAAWQVAAAKLKALGVEVPT